MNILSDTFTFSSFPKPTKGDRVLLKATRKALKSHQKIQKRIKSLSLKKAVKLLYKKENRTYIIKEVDKIFSEYMKRKSHGKCVKCGKVKAKSGVSHYYSRRYLSTRWLESNCVWACWTCHTWVKDCLEHTKSPGDYYYNLMQDKLGSEGFDKLNLLAHSDFKIPTSDIQILILDFEDRLKNM